MSQRAASVAAVERVAGRAEIDRHKEARAWLEALRAGGVERERAAERLHALMLRAARFELERRRGSIRALSRESIDDLAVQSADDALSAILLKLDDYRFESRFTTWAYKFAILEAAVRARRRAWQERELPIDVEAWNALPSMALGPSDDLEARERLRAIIDAIRTELSPHQREVLSALVLNGVPIDVLAERLGTSRGALYKTLHDARRKLRTAIGADHE
jgi:RNA polymerase sigma-70 factor (ECF subfamily)